MREVELAAVTTLPAVLDVRDDLHRIREAVEDEEDADALEAGPDEDLRDDALAAVVDVRESLDEFAERDLADREGLLEDAENRLLALEERLDGEAADRARAARNRVRLYREAVTRTPAPLAVMGTGFRDADPAAEGLPVGDAVLSATVINDGDEPRDAVLVVGFYAPDGTDLGEQVGPSVELDPEEQRTVEMSVGVPTDADYYTVAATTDEPS